MVHNISIKIITESLISIENELNLFNWTIEGIKVWEIIRVPIFVSIQEELNPQKKENYKRKSKSLKDILIRLKNCIIYNPILKLKKVDTIVFESSRKYLVDDEYIDIYTKYLCNDLSKAGEDFEIYQSSYSFDKLAKNSKRTSHLDFIILISKLIRKMIKVRLSEKDAEIIQSINKKINKSFNLKFDCKHYVTSAILEYRSKFWFFDLLFRIKKPQKIYLTNYCDKAPIIKAAKDNNIEVIELQHGFTSKYNLIYHFPNVKENSLAYFPHKYYSWEGFYNDFKLPISSNNIISMPNKHMEYLVDKLRNIPKKEDQILVVSQNTLTRDIASCILQNINSLEKYKILYKLHPAEQKNWQSYSELKRLSSYKNVKITDNSESIYKLMAESKFCIGVYSTALIESIYFGCKVFLLDLPGVEMMEEFLKHENVSKIENNKIKKLQSIHE